MSRKLLGSCKHSLVRYFSIEAPTKAPFTILTGILRSDHLHYNAVWMLTHTLTQLNSGLWCNITLTPCVDKITSFWLLACGLVSWKSASWLIQYGRQAAILSFACLGDNFRMLGPTERNVYMQRLMDTTQLRFLLKIGIGAYSIWPPSSNLEFSLFAW
jgi:hypothetical protein